MLRKLINGTFISFTFLGLATLGNQAALGYPQLWILAAIGIAAQVFQPLYKPLDRTAPPQDRGTGNHLVWSVYISQAAGLIESVYFRYPESFDWTAATTVGLLLAIGGLALRSWSVYELGRFFTWHIIVQPDHKVVKTGPYRAIRHPGYCGALVLYVFTMVFIHAWVSAFIALALVSAAVWRRIRYEEEWLNRHLGEQYTHYAMEVRALIPYVW